MSPEDLSEIVSKIEAARESTWSPDRFTAADQAQDLAEVDRLLALDLPQAVVTLEGPLAVACGSESFPGGQTSPIRKVDYISLATVDDRKAAILSIAQRLRWLSAVPYEDWAEGLDDALGSAVETAITGLAQGAESGPGIVVQVLRDGAEVLRHPFSLRRGVSARHWRVPHADWAVLAASAWRAASGGTSAELSVRRLQLERFESGATRITPQTTSSGRWLQFLEGLRQADVPFQVDLCTAGGVEVPLEVNNVFPPFVPSTSGAIVVADSSGLDEIRGHLASDEAEPEYPSSIHGWRARGQAGAARTHVVATGLSAPDLHRELALTEADEVTLHQEIANGGLADYPMCEMPSAVHPLYFDIDLPWSVLSAPSLSTFKAQQLAKVISSQGNLADFTRDTIRCLFPGVDGVGLLSRRSDGQQERDGYHLVFEDVLVSKSRATVSVVRRLLELAIARALEDTASGEVAEIASFVVGHQTTFDATTHVSIAGERLAARGVETEEELTDLLTSTLRAQSDALAVVSPASREALILAGWAAMHPTIRGKYLAGLSPMVSVERRKFWVAKLARRLSWQMVHLTSIFDQAVYKPGFGLRLLGSAKAGDPGSRYLPTSGESPTSAVIAKHSIRRPSTASPSAMSDLLESFTEPFRKSAFLAGYGLTHDEGAVVESDAGGNASLRVTVDEGSLEEAAVRLGVPSGAPVWRAEAAEGPWALDAVETEEGDSYGRPAVSNGFIGRTRSSLTGSESVVTVDIQIYIPAPAVSLSSMLGTDMIFSVYGGDGRGPSLDSDAKSRFSVSMRVDRETGAVDVAPPAHGTSYFGESVQYSAMETYSPLGTIPYRGTQITPPGWWRGVPPGTRPIDADTLQSDSDNFSARGSRGANGVRVSVGVEGANPLSSFAPPIDLDLDIDIDDNGNIAISGDHNGFPAYSVAVNGEFVYDFDPVAEGNGPTALFDATGKETVSVQRPLPEAGDPAPEAPPANGDGWGVGGDGGPGGPGEGYGGDQDGSGAGAEPGDPGEDPGAGTDGAGAAQREGSGPAAESVSVPVSAQQNSDGSVTLSDGNGSETFTQGSDGWYGDKGGSLQDDVVQALISAGGGTLVFIGGTFYLLINGVIYNIQVEEYHP